MHGWPKTIKTQKVFIWPLFTFSQIAYNKQLHKLLICMVKETSFKTTYGHWQVVRYEFSKVLLAIDKEHTVPQRALECRPGFGGSQSNTIWDSYWALFMSSSDNICDTYCAILFLRVILLVTHIVPYYV